MQRIPTKDVMPGRDARPADPGAVAQLAASIKEVGLLNPITVRPAAGGWEILAGVHRWEAHKQLGAPEISAFVIEADDLHAELVTIDENLCRADWTPSQRAVKTARRKAIYELLHPETKNGGDRRGPDRQVGELKEVDRFTADTAAKTGHSERTVQRDAERGEKVIPEAMDMIRGTKLDTGAYLDRLKRMSPNDQITAVKRDLAAPRSTATPPSKRTKAESAKEGCVERLMRAWQDADSDSRSEFLQRIGAAMI